MTVARKAVEAHGEGGVECLLHAVRADVGKSQEHDPMEGSSLPFDDELLIPRSEELFTLTQGVFAFVGLDELVRGEAAHQIKE